MYNMRPGEQAQPWQWDDPATMMGPQRNAKTQFGTPFVPTKKPSDPSRRASGKRKPMM